MLNFTQIKETCLYVQDLDKTEQFYAGLLQLPVISKETGRHVFFRAGSSVLLCFIAEVTKNDETLPPHFATGKQHIAFEVPIEDYESAKNQITRKNIPITHEHSWGVSFNSFYFEDPDGHVLEIVPAGMWE